MVRTPGVPDRAAVWRVPSATPVNHLRAGAPVIALFTANWASSAVIEPGDPIMLRWTVTNAEHVRIDRTSASGPTFGGSPPLVDPAVAHSA